MSGKRDSQDSTSEHKSPILVMWDSRTKAVFAHLIPPKGIDYDGIEAFLKLYAADLDRLGYKRVAFRSDNEPPLYHSSENSDVIGPEKWSLKPLPQETPKVTAPPSAE